MATTQANADEGEIIAKETQTTGSGQILIL